MKDYYTREGSFIPVQGSGIVDEIFNHIADELEKKTGARRRTAGHKN